MAEAALAASELRYRRLFETAKDGILILDAETGAVADVNPFLIELLGYSREIFLGTKLWELGFFKDIVANQENFEELQQKEYVRYDDMPLETSDGRRIDVEFVSNVYLVNGHKVIQCNIRDITARRRAEAALRESEESFRYLFEYSPIGKTLTLPSGEVRVNEAFCAMLGYSADELKGKTWQAMTHPDDVEASQREWDALVSGERAMTQFTKRYLKKDGSVAWTDVSVALRRKKDGAPMYFVTAVNDITGRMREAAAKSALEAQLHQAQKMESVGRLAGGVAHDFNNMLGVILGHTELALAQVDPGLPLHADLGEIRKAAMRSADLTRQLLAFARKQTVAPKVLNLNDAVAGMLSMLRRLIGEDVEVQWQPAADLWPVKVDPSQIDQILANLSVNARDAITGVGTLTIETCNCTLDERYCAANVGTAPGDFVRLTVSDSGCGMDRETLAHLFEPFFTTKVMGKGTGLGLATVYGIVKQNHGFVNVYSEPNLGTTFTIYLPRHLGSGIRAPSEHAPEAAVRGHETILVVEDEAAILSLSARVLEQQGYTVLAAGTPGEAIRLAHEHGEAIDLLMTDVVMPEMNGRVLARNLLALYPDLKRLFMSGYTADVIAHHGVLDHGVHFIQKPFSVQALAAKVREVLDAQD